MEAGFVAIKWRARGLSGAPGSYRFVQTPALATPGLFAASSAPSWWVVPSMCFRAAEFLVLWNFAQQIIQAEPAS